MMRWYFPPDGGPPHQYRYCYIKTIPPLGTYDTTFWLLDDWDERARNVTGSPVFGARRTWTNGTYAGCLALEVTELLVASILTAVGSLTAGAEARLVSSASVTATPSETEATSAVLVGQVIVHATPSVIASVITHLNGISTLQGNASVTSEAVSHLQAIVSVTSSALRTRNAVATLQAISTLSATALRTRIAVATLQAISTLSATALRTSNAQATLNAVATITATGTKQGVIHGVAGQATGSQRSGAQIGGMQISFPSSTTNGNLLIAVVSYFGNQTLSSISDNRGNSWARAVKNYTAQQGSEIWYAIVNNAGSTTLTLAMTGTGSDFLSVAINEYSGASSSPLDQTNSHWGSSTTPTSNSITTSIDRELYVGGLDVDSSASGTITPGSGWTSVYTHNATSTLEGISFISKGDGTSITAGTYSATWSFSGSAVNANATIASFKPA